MNNNRDTVHMVPTINREDENTIYTIHGDIPQQQPTENPDTEQVKNELAAIENVLCLPTAPQQNGSVPQTTQPHYELYLRGNHS